MKGYIPVNSQGHSLLHDPITAPDINSARAYIDSEFMLYKHSQDYYKAWKEWSTLGKPLLIVDVDAIDELVQTVWKGQLE